MGRIKTTYLKRVTQKIFNKHQDEYTNDFNKNKELVEEHAKFNSKKLRNIVAGYATRLNKSKDNFWDYLLIIDFF